MDLLTPKDEAQVRLVVFGLALCAIATRTNVTQKETDESAEMNPRVVIEAQMIAQAFIDEAHRLEAGIR